MQYLLLSGVVEILPNERCVNISVLLWVTSRLSEFWRSFFKSYDSVGNDLPGCFGAHKNVPANLDVRISIRTAKRHTVNRSIKYATEC